MLLYLFSIQALLSAPNPDDPLSENIAKHWKANETEAVETGILLFQFIVACGYMLVTMESLASYPHRYLLFCLPIAVY